MATVLRQRTAQESVSSRGDGSETWLMWALMFAPFTVLVLFTFRYTPDDALITMRYAANLANGNGPVFNAGERVEGFSSPLHLLIQTVLAQFPGGHELLRAKIASLVFGVLTLLVAGVLLLQLGLPRWAVRLAAFLTGASFMLAFGSANGLETTTVSFLVAALILLLYRGDHSLRPILTGIVGVCLALARPETVVLVVVAGIGTACVDRPEPLWRSLRWIVVSLSGLLAYLAFRIAYYGDVLPNTYYAKRTALTPEVLVEGGALCHLGACSGPPSVRWL